MSVYLWSHGYVCASTMLVISSALYSENSKAKKATIASSYAKVVTNVCI